MTSGIEPEFAAHLAHVAELAAGRPAPVTIGERRAAYVALGRDCAVLYPAGVTSRDRRIPAGGKLIPVRTYTREGAPADLAIIFLHGGGWVLGDLDSHDSIAADLCGATSCTVVAVDYRRAPEHPFPAAFEDANDVLCHVARETALLGIVPSRIGLVGDSAGGNLVAALALASRDHRGPPIAVQALLYPVLGDDLETASYRQNAQSPTLTRDAMAEYWGLYGANEAARENPCCVPLKASHFRGLPPAIILTAGLDPARDDGIQFAKRLRGAGVAVEHRNAQNLPHGWLRGRHKSPTAGGEFQALCKSLRTHMGVE